LYALSKLSWALAKARLSISFKNGNSFLYLAGVGKVIFRRIILTSSYAFFGHQALDCRPYGHNQKIWQRRFLVPLLDRF
jgi:hypothetical protein